MKLPADNGPDWSCEHQQKSVFAREAVHEKHTEDHNRHSEYDTQNQQRALAKQLCPSSLALLILSCDVEVLHIPWCRDAVCRCPWLCRSGLVPECLYLLEHLFNRGLRCVVGHRCLLYGKVDARISHPWYLLKSLFDAHGARGTRHSF